MLSRLCLEIKCPCSIDKVVTIEMSPMEIAEKFGDRFFLKKDEDGELHLPKQHHCYAQLQGELAVITGNGAILWCTAMVW